MTNRHQATQHLLDQLDSYQHLPESLGYVSAEIAATAHSLAATLEDGPELAVGLRHLLDAKDALVRQRVIDLKAANAPAPVNSPEPELTRSITTAPK